MNNNSRTNSLLTVDTAVHVMDNTWQHLLGFAKEVCKYVDRLFGKPLVKEVADGEWTCAGEEGMQVILSNGKEGLGISAVITCFKLTRRMQK